MFYEQIPRACRAPGNVRVGIEGDIISKVMRCIQALGKSEKCIKIVELAKCVSEEVEACVRISLLKSRISLYLSPLR